MKVDVIGIGKVGSHISTALNSKSNEEGRDIDCRAVNSRTLEGFREDADILLLTVSDSAIAELAGKLSGFKGILAHVSGSTSINVLGRTERGGVFYPFQSFSKEAEVEFRNVPILIEATDQASLEKLSELGNMLSRNVLTADGEKRRLLHLAGVFGCNFVNEMMAIAFAILDASRLPRQLLYPLIELTVRKALDAGPENVRTGPASRGDMATIALQQCELAENPELLKIYDSITDLILHRKS